MDEWVARALSEGGTLGLAIVAFWMLNRVWSDRLKERDEFADSLRDLLARAMEVIDGNTQVIGAFLERTGAGSSSRPRSASRAVKSLPVDSLTDSDIREDSP